MFRAVWRVALSILAILLQAAAVVALLEPSGEAGSMLTLCALQVLASLCVAVVAGDVIVQQYSQTTYWRYVYVFAGCLFMPVVGMLVFFLVWLMLGVFGYNFVPLAAADRVAAPVFVASLVKNMTYGGGVRVRARLENEHSDDSERMSAMTALQSMPIHLTEKVLRRLLSDQQEELRLLAYGLIDGAEKSIMEKIAGARQKLLEGNLPSGQREHLHALLAQMYWELSYQHLVAGDVHEYVLDKVAEHASTVLDTDANDGLMWYLQGRCALLKHQPEQATHCLGQAASCGFPRERLRPWQAEAAFQQKQFMAVRGYLSDLDSGLAASRLQPSIQYWTTSS